MMDPARAELVMVPPSLIDSVWLQAEPFLQRAYDKMGYDPPADTRERLADGKCDLWMAHMAGHLRAVCVTSLRGSTLNIECLAGDGMNDWLHTLWDLEDIGRRRGMTVVQFDGRRGWADALKGHGYKMERIVMRKEL